MAKVNLYQLKAENIRFEMQKGRGSSPVFSYPVELEPSFKPFSHKVEMPKSGFWNFLTAEKSATAPTVKPATPLTNLGFININLPKEGKLNLPQFEKFILSLKFDYPLSFEIIGTSDKIAIQLVCRDNDINLITGIFQTHFPNSESVDADDNLKAALQNVQPVVAAYCLKESHFFPLNYNFKLDPYSILLSNLNSISQGMATLQIIFIPAKNNWADNMRLACHDEYDSKKSYFADLPDLPKLVSEKTGKPLFAVSIRLIAASPQVLNQTESFLLQYANQHNGFIRLNGTYPGSSILQRTTHTTGMMLNAEELAGLMHLPDPELNIPKLAKAKKSVPAPRLTQAADGILLGQNIHQGKSQPVMVSQEWLTRHVAIFGGTGTGKTNLLGFLFGRLILAHGAAFIDPNGDAAQEFLSLIPQNRINDVFYFDPLKNPLSINPLDIADKQQTELATVNLLVAIQRLFDASAWGPRMEWILRKTIKTLLLAGNKTLLDIPLILTNEKYRKQIIPAITDPDLLNFWQDAFPKMSLHALVPILDKLSIFTDSDIIKPIIGQPKSDIDFQEIINGEKIFIANLSKGTIGEKNAHILGSFILSAFQMAILGRANISKEQRKFYPLIIDEFHNYADSSNVFSINSLLSEARKYNVSLITATQFLSQIDKRIKDAIFGNVGTLISLRVGIDDAQALQKELGQFAAEDLLNLKTGQAIIRMGAAQDSFNLQIPLMQKPAVDYTEEILKSAQAKRPAIVSAPIIVPTPIAPFIPTLQPQQIKTTLTPDEKQFLEFLYQSTELLPLGKIEQQLCFDNRKMRNLVDDLSSRGLMTETKLSLSTKGRKARVVIITSDGITALGYPAPVGKGGAIHQYFQRIIKAYAQAKGYQVIIEKPLANQQAVDLHLENAQEKAAVEISITTDATDELANIQKNLNAAYDRIIVLCDHNQTLDSLRNRIIQSYSPQIQGKIFTSALTDFHQHI